MQLSFLNEWLRISDCDVLDVGANIGQSFHPLVRDKTKIRYFAFEPVTAIYIQLVARLAETRNESVHAFPIHRAISDTDGFCSIWYSDQEGYKEAATIIEDLSNSDRMGKRVYRSEVECERLITDCP